MRDMIEEMNRTDAGSVGIALDLGDDHQHRAEAYERLGYASLWVPGGQLSSLEPLQGILRATSRAVVAPGIAALGVHSVETIVAAYAAGEASAAGRLLVGLGGPQTPTGALEAIRQAADRLDDAAPPVPATRRALAALGPRKLELAAERFGGAITLLVTPDFTRAARVALGDAALIVHQMAVLESDAERAREAARGPLSFLTQVGGYVASFRRMGFTDQDITGLSDRLVDSVVVWGDEERIAERFDEHRQAGADHLVLSLLESRDGLSVPEAARRLAPSLLGGAPRVARAMETR